MSNKAWLGVDTSNYTTSVSAVIDDGRHYNIKIPLCVKAKEKGIRQSEAVFMHIKNLPNAFNTLFSKIKLDYPEGIIVSAIGASSRPRSQDGSYMPCFLSGISAASSMATAMGIPYFEFSHQEGHIRSALFGAHLPIPEHFYSFHLSGGTCELLDVHKHPSGFRESIIAESLDITLGQLVDRTGVMLGIDFPCGPQLEILASQSKKVFNVSIKGESRINLSGFENKAIQMKEKGETPYDIAAYIYSVIIAAVDRMLESRDDKSLPVLFAGGVSGSLILKENIAQMCNSYFASSELSSDNAVGIAILTKEKFLNE